MCNSKQKTPSQSPPIASTTFSSYYGPSFMGCKFSIVLLESHPTNTTSKATSLKFTTCNFVLGIFAM
jgi:hypothetical protein